MSRRIRTIKPEILDDEVSASLPDSAWRLWVSMWLLADDAGRLRGSPPWLRGQIFWARPEVDDEETNALLSVLEASRVIVRYQVGQKTYFQVRNWTKHQRIDKPRGSAIPGPSDIPSGRPPRLLPEASSLDRERDIEKEKDIAREPLLFALAGTRPNFDLAEIYDLYPRKEGKQKGLEKLKKTITTVEEFYRCKKAVENYASSRAGEDPNFTKHFSTWSSCWEDYVDFKPPKQLPAKSMSSTREPPKYKTSEQAGIEADEAIERIRRERAAAGDE